MDTIVIAIEVISLLFSLLYLYNILYLFVPFFKKHNNHKEIKIHNIAILIAARNEHNVIHNLIDSIKEQDYPQESITIFVVADNCDDETALIAREHGAICYERFNKIKVGKGYALQFLIDNIRNDYGKEYFDAYIVLDADNVLEPNYVSEMNKTFSDGYKIITSYRNSKNFGDNWISAGYGMQFMRESRYLNNSRMLLNTSCAVSGTGFLFSSEICNKYNGWDCFTLTEDIEFTVRNIIDGEKVGYCPTAMLYDEQPVKFSQAWSQRKRWAKGFFQVWKKYKKELLKNIFKKKNFTSSADMFLVVVGAVITIIGFFGCALLIAFLLVMHYDIVKLFRFWYIGFIGAYILCLLFGAIVTITEWKRIHCKNWKKILYTFTFPIFMLTYIPITIAAFFQKVEWKPIEHTKSFSITQIRSDNEDETTETVK